MPKRIPTPPPGDDEPRYLAVVHPYAISGTCNMELPKDRQDFARWVACCVDKDAFFAIFHKPSSRGMVIIEISRDYPNFDNILGEHRWSEFLQSPTEEEMDRVSQIFYCTYNTGRIVQKNGWKRIDVDETWFKAWSPNNRQIKFPYPPTHFCDVPVEDRTNHSLCRPLPGAVITPPVVQIAAPQPVIGSAAWVQKKEKGPSIGPITTQGKQNTGPWGKSAPKAQVTATKSQPTANVSVRKTVGILQGPPTGPRKPAVGGGPIAVKSSNVWQNTGKKSSSPSVVTNWEESPPASRQNTPVSPAAANQTLTAPPGLPARKNAWGSGVAPYATHPSFVPGSTAPSVAPDRSANLSATSWGSTSASTSSPDSDSGPDLTTATESDNPYAVQISFSESMEEEFHGMGITAMEDESDLRELDSIAPTWDEPGVAAWETPNTSAWDDDPLDAEEIWRQNQVAAQPMLCNAHGIICKKGICAEYAKQLRNTKRAEEFEKRKNAGANKGKKGARSKGRGAAKKNNDENEPVAMQNNPFRGPGAPVKTNWRGAPRQIVSADAMEKLETAKDDSDDGWGNSDSEHEPSSAAVVPPDPQDAASDVSWGISEGAYNPWAATAEPVTKVNRLGGKPPSKKKPVVSSNWADQVEAELAGGSDADRFSTISSKRGSSVSGWGATTTTSKPSKRR